ncbi:MAG: flagellar basal body L-ring protein FlgH [Planctomycetota bacterium]|nr:flagellar basal body L-ring protein FlgH [Planctomycetota bacterium]
MIAIRTNRLLFMATTLALPCLVTSLTIAQNIPDRAESPSSSLMAGAISTVEKQNMNSDQHTLRYLSMFAIEPVEPREFQKHDLIQIIVRETSRAKSKHELETEKDYNLDGSIDAFPSLQLANLGDLPLRAGSPENFPIEVGVDFSKEFEGTGDYKREDDLTARLTAEIIEIQPNGNLVLEARTFIKNDEEEMTIKVTGICRPDDITLFNTILSSQVHDLKIEKTHEGELKNANTKGFIAQILDAVFAF